MKSEINESVHIIGLCGVGMSATALLLKEAGWRVTGSDAECYGPPGDILKKGGLTPILGYSPENIPEDVDRFVIGRNAKLAPEINEEVRAALATKKPVYSFPEMLGKLTLDRQNVVVVGSYGKSTTTTLISHILRHSGVDAGYFVGAEPAEGGILQAPSGLGSDDVFVLEGDEYPSAHDDPRAKFMHLHPRDVVLTAVVHDHVNVYPTYEDYQKPFIDLLKIVEKDGIVVVCADEPAALALTEASGKTVVPYGIEHGSFRATNIEFGPRTRFTLLRPDGADIDLETGLFGRHNVEDIIAASAYVLSRDLVSPEALQAAVATFPGVRRRLDNISPNSAVPVFEGFGTSYEKARSAIDAIRLHFAEKRLVIVFEPHTFSWRNRNNLSWYDQVFANASLLLVAAPAAQGADTHEQLSHQEILERVAASGIESHMYDPHHVSESIDRFEENDVVLVLTSGDLEGTLPSFASSVAERFPKE
ncbi:MAG: UDP-N-acetylmuramate--L-alanyl-gamma-D-glutamyl-meso-diaminopimelate ligase [Parcubacteria group bacterium]|nr:UDP-N-acetylmuramate--L-alanyl-gamma-D-glutamyl-meso-diaminopimelate ligase [Parcubacteria group bacterium]